MVVNFMCTERANLGTQIFLCTNFCKSWTSHKYSKHLSHVKISTLMVLTHIPIGVMTICQIQKLSLVSILAF